THPAPSAMVNENHQPAAAAEARSRKQGRGGLGRTATPSGRYEGPIGRELRRVRRPQEDIEHSAVRRGTTVTEIGVRAGTARSAESELRPRGRWTAPPPRDLRSPRFG